MRPGWLLSAVVLVVLGCSSSSDEWTARRPKTYPVRGVVLHNGRPVEGATVVFSSPAANKAAYGVTDRAGRFVLTTFEEGDGAVAGAQEVQISKIKTEFPEGDPEVMVGEPKETHLLPARYADFATSELTAEVKTEGENRFEFKLTD